MFFKAKYFLDLSGDKQGEPAVAALVAPMREAPAAAEPAAKGSPVVIVSTGGQATAVEGQATAAAGQAGVAVGQAAAAAPLPSGGLTTAEAIAAELAAAQANRPAPSLATFAPEALTPGGANPRRRRSGGANLAAFKAIARSYSKN
jgi:hypothetical protein